jgi:DNA-directed RNA polymerase specialized sigma24 family protein
MIPSDPQSNDRVNLAPLLNRARDGDETAFNRLMEQLGPPVVGFLRRNGASPDDAEDALSKAMLIVYRLMAERRFDAIQIGGFIAYFRKVAWNEWLHRPEVRQSLKAVSLDHVDSETGRSTATDIPDPGSNPADPVINREMYAFLERQLDIVFVAGRSGPDRMRGVCEKLAFLYFYQDGMTQNEIHDALAIVGQNFPRMTPITSADLNNWLSMGRSLKALIKHLATNCQEIVESLIELHLRDLRLDATITEVLRMAYLDRCGVDEIAAKCGMNATTVKQALAAGNKELIDGLTRTIKVQLKFARST